MQSGSSAVLADGCRVEFATIALILLALSRLSAGAVARMSQACPATWVRSLDLQKQIVRREMRQRPWYLEHLRWKIRRSQLQAQRQIHVLAVARPF